MDAYTSAQRGVPKEVTFKTKPAIALEQLRWASAAGLPRGVVLMDAGYGADTDLRTNITALGLSYVAGIMPQTSVWAPGAGPQPPKNWSGCGRPPELLRRDGKHQPISVKKLAFAPAVKGLAQDHVAGSHGRAVVLTLCPRARSCSASRLLAR